MSISKQDFCRRLPKAFASFSYVIEQDQIKILLNDGFAVIHLAPEPDLEVAMICLPVLAVDIAFESVSGNDQKAFILRFERAFHRGGG